ncbi:hypothetical protein C9439_03395 [archaeon SCG-AAA382B04]|nr:hypothetical protein C9439_03395 [archaeon SCG-AAA382B04]
MTRSASPSIQKQIKTGNAVGINIEKDVVGDREHKKRRFSSFVRECYSKNKKITLSEKNLSQKAAKIALGFAEPDYTDFYPRIKGKTKRVILTPIYEINDEIPDLLVLFSCPGRIMEMIQKFVSSTGKALNPYCMSSGSSVASELVAYPYIEEKANISFLCSGAREVAGYKDKNMGISFPDKLLVKRFEKTEGLKNEEKSQKDYK